MALVVPKEALRSLIATLSGLPEARVYWSGEAEKHLGPFGGGKAGKITLNVPAIAEGQGLEPRRDYDEAEEELSEEWGRHDEITMSVRADNFLGLGEAFDLLNTIRFHLRLPTARAALNAADLAFIDAPSIVTLDAIADQREISAATLDVRLAFAASTPATVVTWIEKVTSQSPPFTDPEVAAMPVVDIDRTP